MGKGEGAHADVAPSGAPGSSHAALLGERGRTRTAQSGRKKRSGDRSPFFAPSTPRKVRPISSPGGTVVKLERIEEKEHKSTIIGASANLINAIVGAGIVGIAFAIKECGLVAGFFMVAFSAVLTEKSLRLLVETARHLDVGSYETLFEATFGIGGFFFISANMFIMAYGAMLSYLMLVKDTLPVLLGFAPDDEPMRRAVLTVSSMLVILPLSSQRDMADLAKTSRISVTFDCILVVLVAIFSPISNSLDENGGFGKIISRSIYHPGTFFVGLGVLSFAFVCQHSAFIIAGSLERPSKNRWGTVTRLALTTCFVLATIIGVCGYLGFLDSTQGDILNNFGTIPGHTRALERGANVARGLLCTTMFFVYPMESFVARHVCVVLLFKGRRAHEGEDHSVLARRDRRIALTVALYILALVPALLFKEVGEVLAITGAIGGSCLSYIGPGCTYLAAHGSEFLDMVAKGWGNNYVHNPEDQHGNTLSTNKRTTHGSASEKLGLKQGLETDVEREATKQQHSKDHEKQRNEETSLSGFFGRVAGSVFWFVLLMPLWCKIASIGQRMLKAYEEKLNLMSPHPNRLGNVIHQRQERENQERRSDVEMHRRQKSLEDIVGGPALERANSLTTAERGSVPAPPQMKLLPESYGATAGGLGDRGIAAAIAAAKSQKSAAWQEDAEEDPQRDPPAVLDFVIAIFYIVFGVVALCAGLISISME